jgi:cell shape-determining protein MreC
MTSVDDTMAQYRAAREDYVNMLKTVYTQRDTATRSAIIESLKSRNQRLVGIAQSMLGIWRTLSSTPTSNQTLNDLQQDLVKYQQDLETLKGYKDENTKLNMIYADMTGDVTANRIMYFGHVIVILILLVAVFVMFVLRGISETMTSVVESILPQPSGSWTGA